MSEQPVAYAPGLYGLVGGAVNVFVLDSAESGVTIIDAGLPGSTKRILKLVETIGRTSQDVKQILITHTDFDHIGGLKALVKATGATVYASAESVKFIRKRGNPVHIKMPLGILTAGIAYLFRAPIGTGQAVADGETLAVAGGIRVIHTPGHTSEHTAYFWERERALFAGDLLNMMRSLNLSPQFMTWNLEQTKQSVKTVLGLDPAVICAGHGPVWQAASDPDRIKALLASL
jgi:glyoxylase-like metal-dependent hydrolase (beta-lactamase superfamily II)